MESKGSEKMSYILFTHNDLDGVGCGILAKLAYKEQIEVRYNSVHSLNYQVKNFLEKNDTHTFMYITDLSVHEDNEKAITDWILHGGAGKLIDHHKSALHLNEHDWAAVTVSYEDGRLTSATSLLYDYLVDSDLLVKHESLDQFVELVRQYDTWEWDKNNNQKAKRLNDLFYLLSIDEFEERMVNRLENDMSQFDFDDFEKQILDMEENKMERYLKRKQKEIYQTMIDNHCVGIVHAENYISELGNLFGKKNTHLDYIAIVSVGNKRISLRTIHEHVDVSEVAAKYEGGGHAKASGCNLNEEAFPLFVVEPFKMEPIRMDADKNEFNVKKSPKGSLYDSKHYGTFFIYQNNSGNWQIENNEVLIEEDYESFEAAEQFMKRTYAAWLVPDKHYVHYLLENNQKYKQLVSSK